TWLSRVSNVASTFASEKTSFSSLSISPDGYYVAAGTSGGSVLLWGIAGNYVDAINLHLGPVSALEFTQNSKEIVSGSRDATFRMAKFEFRFGAVAGRMAPLERIE